MKKQQLTQMIKDVRVILEENVNAAPLEGVTDVGSISINEVIKGVIPKAVTAIAKIAPMELFIQPSYKKFWTVPAPAVPFGKVTVNKTEQTIEIPFDANGHTMAEYSNIDFSTGITSVAYDVQPSATTSIPTKLVVALPENTSGAATSLWVEVAWNLAGRGEYSQTITIEQTTAASGDPVYTQPVDVEQPLTKFTQCNGGYFNKPSDYLRTLFVQGSNWQRSVTELTPLSSPFVSIARSDINLSVGNEEKPLVVDSFVNGSGALEVYPAKSGITADFVYIEQPRVTVNADTNKEEINCDDGIYNASVFYAAYLVANIKAYQNAETYKTAALDAINVERTPTNATAGAEVEK